MVELHSAPPVSEEESESKTTTSLLLRQRPAVAEEEENHFLDLSKRKYIAQEDEKAPNAAAVPSINQSLEFMVPLLFYARYFRQSGGKNIL